MTTRTRPVKGIVWENGTAVFLARVPGWTGVALQKADLASITYSVYLVDADDRNTKTVITGHSAVAVTIADTVYDTLQTDARWTLDSTGYNFAHLLDTTAVQAFTLPGRRYLVVYRFTPTGQPPIVVTFQVDVEPA